MLIAILLSPNAQVVLTALDFMFDLFELDTVLHFLIEQRNVSEL
jgi:hypothetical protein